jgi:threonine dehydrogenase-like Zn-dependent dehydrogenase
LVTELIRPNVRDFGLLTEHPERIVTHRYSLQQADQAYRVADQGAAGKVCIVFD